MNELINYTQSQIQSLMASIERDKKYFNYPFTNNCDHYYRLLLLHNRLENWEEFLKLLDKFKNSRCEPIEKKSGLFDKLIKMEVKGIPGFVTQRTLLQIMEYMKHLEWKLEEKMGIWNERVQLPSTNESIEGELRNMQN